MLRRIHLLRHSDGARMEAIRKNILKLNCSIYHNRGAKIRTTGKAISLIQSFTCAILYGKDEARKNEIDRTRHLVVL